MSDALKLACLRVIQLVTFVGDASRGILFPVLWPLCQDLGGSQVELGWLVSTFSIGRLVVTNFVGYISDRYRHRASLIFSGVLLVLGVIMWANVKFVGGIVLLFIAQFFLGLGTGSLGVTRSYVVEQTTPEQRTAELSRLTALQYMGFAGTPLLGAAFLQAGKTISSYAEYAMPAYLLLFLSLLCLGLLIYPFVDLTEKDEVKEYIPPTVSGTQSASGIELSPDLENRDNSTAAFSTQDETKDVENNSADDKKEASKSCEIHAKKSQTIDDGTFNPMQHRSTSSESTGGNRDRTDRRHNSIFEYRKSVADGLERRLSIFDLSPMAEEEAFIDGADKDTPDKPDEEILSERKLQVFRLMMWLNFTTRGALAAYESQVSALFLDTYNLSELQLGFLVSVAGTIGTVQLVYFKELWCKHFTDYQMMVGGLSLIGAAQTLMILWSDEEIRHPWNAIVSMYLVYAIAYPVGNSAVLGCFSKLQRTGRQAKIQSQFAWMGSLARVLIPIVSGYLESYVDTSSSFGMVLILMILSVLPLLVLRSAIVYFTEKPNEAAAKDVIAGKKDKRLIIVVAISVGALVGIIGSLLDWGSTKE